MAHHLHQHTVWCRRIRCSQAGTASWLLDSYLVVSNGVTKPAMERKDERYLRNYIHFSLIRNQPCMHVVIHNFLHFATIKCTGKCLCGQQVCSGPSDVCTQRAKPPDALQRRGEQSGNTTFNPLYQLMYTWIRCYLHFDVTCLTGFKKRLCAEHHVDIWGYPHVGWVQHAYFRRWSLSCRQSETQVGILNNLIWNKHWLVYMYNNNVIL